MTQYSAVPSVTQAFNSVESKYASRIVWFVCGIAVVLAILGVVGMSKGAGADGDRSSSLSALALKERTGAKEEESSRLGALARLVARPLLLQGAPEPSVGNSNVYLAISSKIVEVGALAARGDDVSPIAQDYGDTLRALQTLIGESPSLQPLLRAGIETWRGSLDNKDGGFLFGLLGIGSELSKISEYTDRLATIHSRIIACRIRLAMLAVKQANRESTANTIEWEFRKAGAVAGTTDDTLCLKNISGLRLTGAMVIAELTGKAGETFSNVFYVDQWEPGQTMLAVCSSRGLASETVPEVVQVRARLLSHERTSRQLVWRVR
jgi:hypothetical protein